jgi:DNA-binding LytR/AlgR family response regulator
MTSIRTRVVIADDEPLARERLRSLLAAEDWLELAGDC